MEPTFQWEHGRQTPNISKGAYHNPGRRAKIPKVSLYAVFCLCFLAKRVKKKKSQDICCPGPPLNMLPHVTLKPFFHSHSFSISTQCHQCICVLGSLLLAGSQEVKAKWIIHCGRYLVGNETVSEFSACCSLCLRSLKPWPVCATEHKTALYCFPRRWPKTGSNAPALQAPATVMS